METKEKKLLLLKLFVMDHFDSEKFKVTYFPSLGKAKVEDENNDTIFLVAKDNNFVECRSGYTMELFRTLQMIETFQHSCEYAWRVM